MPETNARSVDFQSDISSDRKMMVVTTRTTAGGKTFCHSTGFSKKMLTIFISVAKYFRINEAIFTYSSGRTVMPS